MKGLIIGFGSIGERHARNLRALGITDLTVYDALPTRRAAARAHQYRVTGTLEDALAIGPTFAVICTPNDTHIKIAQECANRGIHCFIEKPLDATLQGAEDLIRTVQRKRLIAMVGCNLRFVSSLQKVKQLITRGTLGRIHAVDIVAGWDLRKWRPDQDYRKSYSAGPTGGTILDSIHEIDYLLWLFPNQKIRSVYAVSTNNSSLHTKAEDTAEIILTLTSGLIARIHTDYVRVPYKRTCEIVGDDGTCVWDFVKNETVWHSRITGQKIVFSEDAPVWNLNDMYVRQFDYFLDCIRRRKQPMSNIVEAARVLAVALSAKESARIGQPVRISHWSVNKTITTS